MTKIPANLIIGLKQRLIKSIKPVDIVNKYNQFIGQGKGNDANLIYMRELTQKTIQDVSKSKELSSYLETNRQIAYEPIINDVIKDIFSDTLLNSHLKIDYNDFLKYLQQLENITKKDFNSLAISKKEHTEILSKSNLDNEVKETISSISWGSYFSSILSKFTSSSDNTIVNFKKHLEEKIKTLDNHLKSNINDSYNIALDILTYKNGYIEMSMSLQSNLKSLLSTFSISTKNFSLEYSKGIDSQQLTVSSIGDNGLGASLNLEENAENYNGNASLIAKLPTAIEDYFKECFSIKGKIGISVINPKSDDIKHVSFGPIISIEGKFISKNFTWTRESSVFKIRKDTIEEVLNAFSSNLEESILY